MSQPTKRKQVRIYLDDATEAHLVEVMKRFPRYSESFIMTDLLAAGLEACAENGYEFSLPLNFHIIGQPQSLNESQVSYSSEGAKKKGSHDEILDIVEKHHPSKPSRHK